MLQTHSDQVLDRPKINFTKPPLLQDIYQEGEFIDARDTSGDWRVGYIV